jgi:arginase
MSRVSVVDVPSSAGSYAAGQDQAPAALRAAGLIDALRAAGLEVHDDGDLPVQIWKPDRAHRYAQNVEQVKACLQDLTDRLSPLFSAGDTVLVLGGNCTIALSVMAALQRLDNVVPGLLYVDRHFDLNTPETITDGALDWMGLGHVFSLPGCVDELADAFERRPLLQPGQVALLGVDAAQGTEWEREQADRLGLHVGSSAAVSRDPIGAAASALKVLPPGPLAVHVDVDVLDFTDAPLAENTDGRNSGPSLEQLREVLGLAARDSRFRALSIGELNPTRAAGEPEAILRFVSVLATTLGAMDGLAGAVLGNRILTT